MYETRLPATADARVPFWPGMPTMLERKRIMTGISSISSLLRYMCHVKVVRVGYVSINNRSSA
jgi:hypothetical protein